MIILKQTEQMSGDTTNKTLQRARGINHWIIKRKPVMQKWNTKISLERLKVPIWLNSARCFCLSNIICRKATSFQAHIASVVNIPLSRLNLGHVFTKWTHETDLDFFPPNKTSKSSGGTEAIISFCLRVSQWRTTKHFFS